MIDRAAAVEVVGAPIGTRSGDTFALPDGTELIVGETEWTSGMGRAVVAWLITPLLAAVYRLAFQARVEGRHRHLTSEPMPCHDPPVAWRVTDHPFREDRHSGDRLPCSRPYRRDRPSHEEAVRNQLRGTCGGTRWRYVGGDCLGWWETCKGCKACEPERPDIDQAEAAGLT